MGRTVIEKLEDYVVLSSIVFVLLTPDDWVPKMKRVTIRKEGRDKMSSLKWATFWVYLGEEVDEFCCCMKGPLRCQATFPALCILTYRAVSRLQEKKSEGR